VHFDLHCQLLLAHTKLARICLRINEGLFTEVNMACKNPFGLEFIIFCSLPFYMSICFKKLNIFDAQLKGTVSPAQNRLKVV